MRIFKQVCTLVISFFVFGLIVVYGDTISKTIQVTYRNISILVKGKPIQSEQEPFIYEGRIFAPLRTIAEAVNKNIEWDNEKNQVNITDKQSGNINLPFHKIGERVEVYPYVITLKKVYIEPFKHPEDKTIIGLINIELSLDFIEKKHGVYINQCCSFFICDKNGKYLANASIRNIITFPLYGSNEGSLICKYTEEMQSQDLILVFCPYDEQHPIASIGILLFDLGKPDWIKQ